MAGNDTKAAEILRQVLESDHGEQAVTFPDGTRFQVIRNPEPSVAARLTNLDNPSLVLTVFDPMGVRPDPYPDDLPFIPDQRVVVAAVPGDVRARSVQWWGVRDVSLQVMDLVRQSEEQGWECVEGPQTTPGPFRVTRARLRQGELARTVVSVAMGEGAMVTLTETSASAGRDP